MSSGGSVFWGVRVSGLCLRLGLSERLCLDLPVLADSSSGGTPGIGMLVIGMCGRVPGGVILSGDSCE